MTDMPIKTEKLSMTLGLWIAVVVAIRLTNSLSELPWLNQYSGTLTAVLLVYPPVLFSFYTRSPIIFWKIDGPTIQNSLLAFALLSFLVFPFVFAGNHLYQNRFFGFTYHAASNHELWSIALAQFVIVAFPEEFFFRGYLQEALSKHFPPTAKLFGVPFGRAQWLTIGLFALSHSLITLQWWHVFIVVPAIGFGWLKEKTGRIWAGALFHAACNVFSSWVFLHYHS